MGIRIAHHGVLSQDDHRLDRSIHAALYHLQDGEPHLGGKLGMPRGLEFLPIVRNRYGLVSRKYIGQSPHVASSLDIVLTPEGIDPGGRPPDLPAQHGKVRQTLDVVHRRPVLGDPQTIDDGAGLGPGIETRHLDDGGHIHPRDIRHPLGRIFFDPLQKSLHVFRAFIQEGLVMPAVLEDDVHHPV